MLNDDWSSLSLPHRSDTTADIKKPGSGTGREWEHLPEAEGKALSQIKGAPTEADAPRNIPNSPAFNLMVTVTPVPSLVPPRNQRSPVVRGRGFPPDFVKKKFRNSRSHRVLNQCRQARVVIPPRVCRNQHSSPLRETRLCLVRGPGSSYAGSIQKKAPMRKSLRGQGWEI